MLERALFVINHEAIHLFVGGYEAGGGYFENSSLTLLRLYLPFHCLADQKIRFLSCFTEAEQRQLLLAWVPICCQCSFGGSPTPPMDETQPPSPS